MRGANPRSFLERNLQFHTRIYCIHVLYLDVDRQSRHAVETLSQNVADVCCSSTCAANPAPCSH